MSRLPYASCRFQLWVLHTVVNALPSGILARNFGYKTPGDLAAMAVVVAAFVIFIPLSPFWPLYDGRSEWGRSLRIGLWIRSAMSLLLLLVMLGGGYKHAGSIVFIELYTGATARSLLQEVSRWTGDFLPGVGVIHTGLMTLLTGLVLLGAVFFVAIVVRGILALANFAPADNRDHSHRAGDY